MKTTHPKTTVAAYRHLPLLTAFLLAPVTAHAQNETVQGTLTVEDDVILKDRDLGALTGTTRLFFEEDSVQGNMFYSWQSTKGGWQWGYTGASSTSWAAMQLSEDHVLSLYNTDPTANTGNASAIVLNPGNGSTVSPSVTIGGSPALTLASATGLYVPRSSNNAGSVDSFLMEGTASGAGTIPVQGAGTRMMWYPEKSAFRVGTVTGTQWDNSNVGAYSVAFGRGTMATHSVSTAFGHESQALRPYTTAMGYKTMSSNWYATAMGSETIASGWIATAMGEDSVASGRASLASGYESVASGDRTVAMGHRARATGVQSTSIGTHTLSAGTASTALGVYSEAHGYTSTVTGYFTTAIGSYSTSMGFYTEANSYGSLVIGQYNEGRGITAGETAWQGDDQHSVLEVGIGTGTTPKNALTVLQDGSVEVGKNAANGTVPLHVKADGNVNVTGTLTLSDPQGDIDDGIFGN